MKGIIFLIVLAIGVYVLGLWMEGHSGLVNCLIIVKYIYIYIYIFFFYQQFMELFRGMQRDM